MGGRLRLQSRGPPWITAEKLIPENIEVIIKWHK